jgi:predicted aspartyl protease
VGLNIKAELTAKGISVTGMIAVPSRSIVKPLNLLVDTGADITTLNEIEANKIGIDDQTLEKDKNLLSVWVVYSKHIA